MGLELALCHRPWSCEGQRRKNEAEETRNEQARPDPHSAIPYAEGPVPQCHLSASQSHDQAGAHLKEVHGVAPQAWRHRGDAADEGAAQRTHQRLALGSCGTIDAQPRPVQASSRAGALRRGRARPLLHHIVLNTKKKKRKKGKVALVWYLRCLVRD